MAPPSPTSKVKLPPPLKELPKVHTAPYSSYPWNSPNLSSFAARTPRSAAVEVPRHTTRTISQGLQGHRGGKPTLKAWNIHGCGNSMVKKRIPRYLLCDVCVRMISLDADINVYVLSIPVYPGFEKLHC